MSKKNWNDNFGLTSYSSAKSYGSYSARCAHSHKVLTIKDGVTIVGGAASDPVKGEYDLMVSFDSSKQHDVRAYPWHEKPLEFIYYTISDMNAPSNPDGFRCLIDYVAKRLNEGARVHVGCFSGHGRTGLFLAALYATMTGEKDAITYVRENYCKKAVESKSQVDFLVKHYGVTRVEGSKEGSWGLGTTKGYDEYYNGGKGKKPKARDIEKALGLASNLPSPASQVVRPVGSKGNIWGVPTITINEDMV